MAIALVALLCAAPHESYREVFLAKLEQTDVKDARALIALGEWCESRGESDLARRCYTRAVALGEGPGFVDASRALAGLQLAAREYEEAYARLRLLVEKHGDAQAATMLAEGSSRNTVRQRELLKTGDGFAARKEWQRAQTEYLRAYELLPKGPSPLDYMPAGVILERLARSVEAIDDEYYERVAKPFAGSVRRCTACRQHHGFPPCERCGGEGIVQRTQGTGPFKQTVRQVCVRCKGTKWQLCDTCRSLQFTTHWDALTRDEWRALDRVINTFQNLNVLQRNLVYAIADIEQILLRAQHAAALSFFRAVKPEYALSKEIRARLGAVPPDPQKIKTAAHLWSALPHPRNDPRARANFLADYACEYAVFLQAYDMLRGAGTKPALTRVPQLAEIPGAPLSPEILSAFPEEGAGMDTGGWLAVTGMFRGLRRTAGEPEKAHVMIEGAVPHNVHFFTWRRAAAQELKRFEQGPWRLRVLGLADHYPFDPLEDTLNAAETGRRITVVGRFLRNRLGFPRHWFEVWVAEIGLPPAQEALYALLSERLSHTNPALRIETLPKTLAFFGVDAQVAPGVTAARAFSVDADRCPLGIFIDEIAGFLGVGWEYDARTVVFSTASGAAARPADLDAVLALLRRSVPRDSFRISVGLSSGVLPGAAAEARIPDGLTLQEIIALARKAEREADFSLAAECYAHIASEGATEAIRRKAVPLHARMLLYDALTRRTPVSRLVDGEDLVALRVRFGPGRTHEAVAKVMARDGATLTIMPGYGGTVTYDLRSVEILKEAPISRKEWQAQKRAELAQLAAPAANPLPHEETARRFFLALYLKTNGMHAELPAALADLIADDFEWLAATYFPGNRSQLMALWRTATGQAEKPADAVAAVPEETAPAEPPPPPPAAEDSIPADPDKLLAYARRQFEEGTRCRSKALPGMDNHQAWAAAAMAGFRQAVKALDRLGAPGELPAEASRLHAAAKQGVQDCAKLIGFFD